LNISSHFCACSHVSYMPGTQVLQLCRWMCICVGDVCVCCCWGLNSTR
jgi:hypothetical protein